MVGIMCCEYWILRHRRIKLSDLYHPRKDGIYYYWNGINWRSFISWTVGWAYLIPGFAHTVTPGVAVPQACINLYYLAFPLGFTVSFLTHWALNTLNPPAGLGDQDDVDYYETFTKEEAEKLGVVLRSPSEQEDYPSGEEDREKYGNVVSVEPAVI